MHNNDKSTGVDLVAIYYFNNYSPGVYEHDVCRDRRIEFAEAFGGKKTLCATVSIKCTKGVPDKVRKGM